MLRRTTALILLAFVMMLSSPSLVPGQSRQPMPQTARDLAMMRAYYDKTVWKKEVLAQRHEKTIVKLWDQLIRPSNKFDVLAAANFQRLKLGKTPTSESMDWGIEQTTFSGVTEVSPKQWAALLKKYEAQGFEIVETEWHHSEFIPASEIDTGNAKPARSIVSAVIYAKHSATKTRYVVKGDLHIEWTTEPDSETKLFQPTVVDATRLTVLQRQGDDVFENKKTASFVYDPAGRIAPPTCHPVIVQDLDGDHLPEISVVGDNKVFWNKGDWQFEEAKLVEYPTKYVNTAAFGDFSGDGRLDLIVAPKLGMPTLYRGDESGRFTEPGSVLKLSDRLKNPVGFAVGDIDADGDLDIFIGQNKVGYQTGEIPTPYYDAKDSFPSHLLLNDGQGRFRDITQTAGLGEKRTRRNFSSSFVDLDDDNDLDLLLTNDFQGNDFFLNDGKGNFTDASETLTPTSYGHGMSHSFGDYNLDGKLDFVMIAMSSTTARRLDRLQVGRSDFPKHNRVRKHMGYGNRLYLSNGKGFEQAPFNASVARTGWSWGSTTLDFDRDGDQDIYITNGQTSGKTTQDYCTRYWCHDLYYQSENRPTAAIKDFFSKMAPVFSGRSLSWNGYEHNALLMNQAGKGFMNVGFLMNCGSVLDSRTTISGDLDLDGKVDLVFEHLNQISQKSELHFLKNNWQDKHHWIGFHLPHSSYGTKVRVHLADGRTLLQHYLAGHSVWAQHPNTLHFGTGECSSVDRVEVQWPNGTTTELKSPKLDQYLSVAP